MSVEGTCEAHQLLSSDSLVSHLQQSLLSCSSAVKSGDHSKSEASTQELGEFLRSISDAAITYRDNQECQNKVIFMLLEIQSHIADPKLDQEVVDALSFELPKAVANFSGVSERCLEIADAIIDHFTEKCNPRDMVSILCEAIDCFGKMTDAPGYIAPLLRGLSKVFLAIQKRHFEQLKESLPVILNALKTASYDYEDEYDSIKCLFVRAVRVATSIRIICNKLEGKVNEKVRALLVLFIFQLTSLISISLGDDILSGTSLVSELAHFFPYCGLSYSNIMTGAAVGDTLNLVMDDYDDFKDSISLVMPGACLSVIWAYISDEVAQGAKQDLSTLMEEIRSSQIKRWQAMETLRHVFSIHTLPGSIIKHGVDFLLTMTDSVGQQITNEDIECSMHIPKLIYVLQVLMKILMRSPDVDVKKNSLTAIKRVIADSPASLRLDMLQILIRNTNSSSMTAILLDCAREDLQKNYCNKKNEAVCLSRLLWSKSALDLVELILRPPCGGPPSLPEQCDAVLSALNLYRFILIKESTGGTNYTEVLSKDKLQMVYREWLLPLRTLVAGIISENKNDDQTSMDIICGLNPVEYVLYRCTELVEEKLKQV